MKADDLFTGPVFILGAPRSGTKLLRDLLIRHPDVAIPDVESEFVPDLVRRYGAPLDLSDGATRLRFVRDVRRSRFAIRARGRGLPLVENDDLDGVDPRSWTAVLEAVLRKTARDSANARVWGDKSPGYTLHARLLAETFPQARFVHIVRDPRSVARSAKAAWGKDVLRSADNWTRAVTAACDPALQRRTCQVRFEEFVADVPTVLRRVSEHLDVPFDPSTCELSRPAERGGTTHVDAEAATRWRGQLAASDIRRIEQIAWPAMAMLGYEPTLAVGPVPLARAERTIRGARDGVVIAVHRLRELGLLGGLRFLRSRTPLR